MKRTVEVTVQVGEIIDFGETYEFFEDLLRDRAGDSETERMTAWSAVAVSAPNQIVFRVTMEPEEA